MDAHEARLHHLIARVRHGTLSRRAFIQRLAAQGLGIGVAATLLADAGLAQVAGPPLPYVPTRRGGGGALRVLLWQGPTTLQPHFAIGSKDIEGCSLFYEPLAHWDADGHLQPVLAAEIPSRENGGVAADGRSVVWKLKKGVSWHDGAPFTADDLLFNWQFATDPATASTRAGQYLGTRFEKVDSHTVRVHFDRPTSFWAGGYTTVLQVPRHLFAAHQGARARESPHHDKPVGTGPYRFVELRPGDLVRGALNPSYHQPHRPHFDSVEVKGGGDATSAARAVLQTGEFDYAWNLLVEDELLKRMETAGKGRVLMAGGGSVEFIQLNCADPWTEVDGERASARSRHPFFRDPVLRQAIALLLDRQSLQDHVFGRAGAATPNILNHPERFRSPNRRHEFSVDRANALLDRAGYRLGPGGVRQRESKPLRFVFQTSTNPLRQKVQAVVKQACAQAGIALELKSVQASVFFGADLANPDTVSKFWADLQMFAFTMGEPDPRRFMDQYVSWEMPTKANGWQGRNYMRWRNDDYDAAYRAADAQLDPVRRAAIYIRMNDLVCGDHHLLPLVTRPKLAAAGKGLQVPLSGWAEDLATIAHWYRV
jgi:peptide/nickel transport system substrate-binding protein